MIYIKDDIERKEKLKQRSIENGKKPDYKNFAFYQCENCNKIVSLAKSEKHLNKFCWRCQNAIAGKKRIKHNKYDLTGEYGIGWTSNTNQEFYFDLEDYDKIKDYTWFYNVKRNVIYADDCTGNHRHIYLHKIILNSKGKEIIDHIDRNKFNNRKNNLRKTNAKGNAINRSLQSNNTSGYIGISYRKNFDDWRAFITLNGKYKHLGLFKDEKDALICRLQAELKYFGTKFAPQRHLFNQYDIK